jgi:hypothetical protein
MKLKTAALLKNGIQPALLKIPHGAGFPHASINTGVKIVLVKDIIQTGVDTKIFVKLFGHQYVTKLKV